MNNREIDKEFWRDVFEGSIFAGIFTGAMASICIGIPYLLEDRLLAMFLGIAITFLVVFLTALTILLSEFIYILVAKLFSNKSTISPSYNCKLLKLTSFIYSPKTQKEIFKPIVADWDEESFEALSKKEIWKARWINMRYTYAFLAAMWQKSPIGDLMEFVTKIAKQ